MKTVNPFNHRVPHAKLVNVKLTSIKRLTKGNMSRIELIGNDDVRNFAYSRADELAEQYGWRAPARTFDQDYAELRAEKTKRNSA